MGRRLASVALFTLLCACGWAQQEEAVSTGLTTQPSLPGPFSLGISAAVYVPMTAAAASFGLGGGENLNIGYQIPETMLFGFGGVSYAFLLARSQSSAPTVFLAAAELGLGVRFPIATFLELRAYGAGGYWYGAFYDGSTRSANPSAGLGLGLLLALSSSLGLGLETRYEDYFGLWQGVAASLGMRVFLDSGDRKELE